MYLGNLPSNAAKQSVEALLGTLARVALKGLWLPSNGQPQGSLSRLPSNAAKQRPSRGMLAQ